MAESCGIIPELKDIVFYGSSSEQTSTHINYSCFAPIPYFLETYVELEKEHKGKDKKGAYWASGLKSELFSTVSYAVKLAGEDRGKEVVENLRTAAKLSNSQKDSVVLCLVLMSMDIDSKELASAAYSAVPEICQTSAQFFLFLQLSKILSHNQNPGWGRGLRRAVRNWYLRWDPKQLAVEVIRHPSHYSWSHKDVLKLAHLSLKNLPHGTQVVLSYILVGLLKTKEKYESVENTEEILSLLEILDTKPPKDASEEVNIERIIKKIQKLSSDFKPVRLEDIPQRAFNSVEVWSHALDHMDYRSLLRAIQLSSLLKLIASEENAGLAAKLKEAIDKYDGSPSVPPVMSAIALNVLQRRVLSERKPKSEWKGIIIVMGKAAKTGPTKKVPAAYQPIVEALNSAILRSSQEIPKTDRKIGVVLEVSLLLNDFINTSTGKSPHKELRGVHAEAITILTLSSGGTCDNLSVGVFAGSSVSPLKLPSPCPYTTLTGEIRSHISLGDISVNIEQGIAWGMANNNETILLMVDAITPEMASVAGQSLLEQMASHKREARLVVCGMKHGGIGMTRLSGILFIHGFNSHVPEIIRSFHEGLF